MMRKIRKSLTINLIILPSLIVFSIPWSPINSVATPDPIPYKPFGTITKSGSAAPGGIELSAWCEGIEYAQTTTQNLVSETWYSITIPGDNLSTVPVEGCVPGGTVVFKIEGVEVDQTTNWAEGQNTQLNLTYSLTEYFFLPLLFKSSNPLNLNSKSSPLKPGQYPID